MWILIVIGAGVISALIHLAIVGFNSDAATVCSIILLHQFVVTSGLMGITGFIMDVCFADKTAKHYGWNGGPFQLKYGFSQLGLAIIGILTIWFRGTFWAGALITLYIYGISGLYTRAMELKRKHIKDPIEFANMTIDVIYHIALTIMSFYVPGVWHIG